MLRFTDLAYLRLLPLAAERFGCCHARRPELGSECRVGIDPRLFLSGAVKQGVTHVICAQDKGVAQIELELCGLAARLGNPPPLNQSVGVGQQFTVRGRLVAPRLHRQPGDRTLAFGQQEINQLGTA